MMLFNLFVFLGLWAVTLADVENSLLTGGECLCVTASRLNIRSGPGTGHRVIVTVNNGRCFFFTGDTRSSSNHIWFSLDYLGRTAWAAGKHLKTASPSECARIPKESSEESETSCNGGPFDQKCLDCICEVASSCRDVGCVWDVYSYSCGYFQLKSDYYQDCGSPGAGWRNCSNDLTCSTTCVRNYVDRYYEHCTGSSGPKCCEQVARIHHGGPLGCKRSATDAYWNRVQACLANTRK